MRFGVGRLGLVLGVLSAAWSPLMADDRLDRAELANERAAIEQFQALDQRLQNVGWKLVRANAPFCPETVPSVGLQLQDLASYGRPEIARAALGMSGDFAVQTAAAGSPSAQSGAFPANREISGFGLLDPNQWAAEDRLYWQRLTLVHDTIDAMLVRSGEITFTFADGTERLLTPVTVCATRFGLEAGSKRAVANGKLIVFGVRFPGFAYEEELFAAAVAHELAHNLLGHRAWLEANGEGRRNTRKVEREADRLMPWLLANAGYDPEAGVRFMKTWGPKHDGGLFRSRTHDGWDERAEFIAAELPAIRALMATDGKADWSTRFRREIEPLTSQPVARAE